MTTIYNITKKAAMFGLDARIALAIFGALSVISGASLFSAIQNSQATALLTDMQEVGKAWEQYLLDTGQDLPLYLADASLRHRSTHELVESTTSGWKGPYISHNKSSTYLNALTYDDITITIPSQSTLEWGLGHASYPTWAYTDVKCDDTTTPCHLGIQYGATLGSKGDTLKALAPIIDQKLDGGDGAFKGKVRWYECCGAEFVLALIYAPYPMPK